VAENPDYPTDAAGKPLTLEARSAAEDGRRFSPSIARNRDAVRDVFLERLGEQQQVLEIASGSGEHGAHITAASRNISWAYSDFDAESLISQSAWAAHAAGDQLTGPFQLDASQPHWGEVEALRPSVIFCANMVHIAPFHVAEGLIAGAGRLLSDGGALFLYGPFARDGVIAPSNARFDADLKRRDERWGVRDLDREISPLAAEHGFAAPDVIEMPANNLSVIFRRT
jgi:hypothetical protein